MKAVHFIGFRTESSYRTAVRLWGQPDFWHRDWDERAAHGGEYAPGDVRIFANGTEADTPKPWAFNDSEVF